MEAGDVPEIRMRWLLLVPSAAVELPSLTSNREPSLLSSPRWHGASLRVGELLEQRHGTKASVKLASAREEQTTVYRRLYTPTNITARTEATLPLKKVLPALIVLPF